MKCPLNSIAFVLQKKTLILSGEPSSVDKKLNIRHVNFKVLLLKQHIVLNYINLFSLSSTFFNNPKKKHYCDRIAAITYLLNVLAF